MKLNGKHAVVTGASRGIGRAIATRLADEGATVGLVSRSRKKLQEVAEEISAKGNHVLVLEADVSDERDVRTLFERFEREVGKLDILVNNAGVHTDVGPVWESSPARWKHDMSVNLFGPYLCCHYGIPLMNNSGVIINTASGAGTNPFPYSTAYGASKAGVIHFTETVATELEDTDISVFGLRPGAVRTDITGILKTPGGKRYLGHIAALFTDDSELLVPPDNAANLVLRLCSEDFSSLSGIMISVFDDPDALQQKADQVKQQGLYTLRMHKLQ
jgi:3-oxoacyl-[acyl-carrier protein] reductase